MPNRASLKTVKEQRLPKLRDVLGARGPLGVMVCVSPWLKRENRAVYSDSRLFVCEDVYALISNGDLALVAEHLDVVIIEPPDWLGRS